MTAARLVPVRLHGPLATRYGHAHAFAIRTPGEAVRALAANFPGFEADFLAAERWAILADGDWRHGEAAGDMPLARELDLCPIVDGQAFIGAAVIGFLIPSIAGTAAANLLGGLLLSALLLGASMLLSPKPKKKTATDSKKDSNYAFGGADNTTEQGVAVPVVYGFGVFVGSVVISAGLELAEEFTPTGGLGATAGGAGVPGGAPDLVPVMVGTRTTQGPAGWLYLGQQLIAGDQRKQTVDLFQNAASSWTWDAARGFLAIGAGGGWQ